MGFQEASHLPIGRWHPRKVNDPTPDLTDFEGRLGTRRSEPVMSCDTSHDTSGDIGDMGGARFPTECCWIARDLHRKVVLAGDIPVPGLYSRLALERHVVRLPVLNCSRWCVYVLQSATTMRS